MVMPARHQGVLAAAAEVVGIVALDALARGPADGVGVQALEVVFTLAVEAGLWLRGAAFDGGEAPIEQGCVPCVDAGIEVFTVTDGAVRTGVCAGARAGRVVARAGGLGAGRARAAR